MATRHGRAGLVAAVGVVTALLPAAPAVASVKAAATTSSPATAQPSIAITSVTPRVALPRAKVTVSGVVTNPTADAVTAPSVQIWSSSYRLTSRDAMDTYLSAAGSTGVDAPVTGVTWSAPTLGPHSTRHWSVTLRASQVGMSSFGVYPLAAQLRAAGTQLAAARTFLPFWPGKTERRTLKQVRIAWVWPLVATPQQGACPALLSNALAADVGSGGRLSQLLAAGQSPDARQAHLTWAIDPALLSDVKTMTHPYRVGGDATCSGATAEPASDAAANWLAGAETVTANQDFFVTPYADVDVAALTHRGLNRELATAFSDGRQEAQSVLGQAQQPGPGPVGGQAGSSTGTGWIAWPAGGIASYSVLGGLAANKVGTVILDSSMMPPTQPVSYTPSAVTTTPDGLGSQLHVLLADHNLSSILAGPPSRIPGLVTTPPAPGTSPGSSPAPVAGPPQAAAFARAQWFLAETAMIAAERPSLARALVVTPPRRWDPGTALAAALLADTVQAPWLRPTSLATLAGSAATSGQVARRQPPQRVAGHGELTGALLGQVKRLVALTRLQGDILTPPRPDYLSTAVAAVESSAWRGGHAAQRHAQSLLERITDYVSSQLQQVRIVDPHRVTLGGKSGAVPVTISNYLGNPVTVRLKVSVPPRDAVTIGGFPHVVTVRAKTQKTIKIPIQAAAAGSTTLSLRLSTPGGTSLPGKAVHMTVEATHFGTLALVIIGIALLVFVITAVSRALRRGGGRSGAVGDGPGDPPGGPDAMYEAVTGPDQAYLPVGTDTVEPGWAEGAHPAKEPDDQASTPGQAGPAGRAGRR